MRVNVICLLFIGAAVLEARQICCPKTGCFSDEYPFNHLPLPICEDRIDPKFQVYTRNNRDTPQTMTRNSIPSVLSATRKTFFLIHGYNNNGNIDWMRNIKNALLDKGNYNVVNVGWGGGAQTIFYPQAATNTRVVGAEIAAVKQNLMRFGVSRSNLVCIGHSLGAHTCGHAGRDSRWGRISGLDPAGPLYEGYPDDARLGKRDADFVDVIHTMGKEGFILDFGTLVPLGHADFYPAGGKVQPGCINKLQDTELMGDMLSCSHSRAHKYYLESIRSNCFNVRHICTDEQRLPGSCSNCGSSCQTMGFDADRSRREGKFYLDVNSKSPFCTN